MLASDDTVTQKRLQREMWVSVTSDGQSLLAWPANPGVEGRSITSGKTEG